MSSWTLEMPASFARAMAFIVNNDNFFITAHQSADGDAYGAALATGRILQSFGKNYQIILPDPVIEQKYRFMPDWETIQPWTEGTQGAYTAAIAVDVSSVKRIGGPAALLPERSAILKIDHHPFEEDFAGTRLESTRASSASILVYYLAKYMDLIIDREMAEMIYTGIVYDNGNFMNANTGPEDFEVASALVLSGVQPQKIANQLHFSNNLPSLQAIGTGLQSMELLLDGQVGWIFLPLEIASRDPRPDTESLANYSVSVRGCQIGVFARQTEENLIKVSLRSRGLADVSQVARHFGGGGHRQAAGFSFEGSLQQFKEQLTQQLIHCLKPVADHDISSQKN